MTSVCQRIIWEEMSFWGHHLIQSRENSCGVTCPLFCQVVNSCRDGDFITISTSQPAPVLGYLPLSWNDHNKSCAFISENSAPVLIGRPMLRILLPPIGLSKNSRGLTFKYHHQVSLSGGYRRECPSPLVTSQDMYGVDLLCLVSSLPAHPWSWQSWFSSRDCVCPTGRGALCLAATQKPLPTASSTRFWPSKISCDPSCIQISLLS